MAEYDLSTEEIKKELERRQELSIVDTYFGDFLKTGRAFLGGVTGGATSLMGIPADIASAVTPSAAQKAIPAISQFPSNASPSETFKKGTGIDEASFPGKETAYRFGEGALAGAAFGSIGGVPGALAAGLVSGLANVGAKAAFPESPASQFLVNTIPGFFTGLGRAAKQNVPSVPTPSVDAETGTLITPGQRSGDPRQLLLEEALKRNIKSQPTASSFYKAQEKNIESFAESIQRLKTTLTPEQLKNVISQKFDAFNKEVLVSFKNNNKKAFDAAKDIRGDVIPTDNVKNTIESLIAEYSKNPEIQEFAAVVKELKLIKSNLTKLKDPSKASEGDFLDRMLYPDKPRTLDKTPPETVSENISVDALQKNLASWGEAAFTGTYKTGDVQAFTDSAVAPGTIKGIARKVLSAFQQDMDAAIGQGIPGARELKQARDGFSEGLKVINAIANSPMNSKVTSMSFTRNAPERIEEMLMRAAPSERAELAAVLGRDYPKVYDTIRAKTMSKILDKYRSGEGFDLKSMYKDQPFSGENAWIFAGKPEENKVKSLINILDIVNRKAKYSDMSELEFQKALRAVSEVAGGFAGAAGKYGTQAIIDSLRVILAKGSTKPENLSLMFFTPSGEQAIKELAKPRPNVGKIPK